MKVLTRGHAYHTKWPTPEFILGPLQPGDVGLLSGADGLGKTWVALTAALSVAEGKALAKGMWPVPRGISGKVLYIAVEDREADFGRRLQSLDRRFLQLGEISIPQEDDYSLTIEAREGQRMNLVTMGRDQRFSLTEEGQNFQKKIEDYRLVIIDPLRSFHDLEEQNGAGMDFLVRWLVTVAMNNQQAILLVHHASQQAILDKRDDHHAGRGATDLPAGCRAVWTLRAPRSDEIKEDQERKGWRVLVNGKASHGTEADRKMLRRTETGPLICDNPAEKPSTASKDQYQHASAGSANRRHQEEDDDDDY